MEMMESKEKHPVLSIVIPVRNSPELIQTCVDHIRNSNFKDYEIIVVDDASTDDTPKVLGELAVRMVGLPEQSGPANARNIGVENAKGKYIFFIDADVRVRDNTLQIVIDSFENNPEVDALFGSYDVFPSAHNIISQYKNLFHHFVHQESRAEASTFWTGCGAVKRNVFLEMGGFDTNYRRPCIEDIEFGTRMHKAGHKILLNKNLQVTHLKHWTFWGMLKADIKDRAIPWTELILKEQYIPNDLNLTIFQRVSALLALIIVVAFALETIHAAELLVLPLAVFPLILALDNFTIHNRVPTGIRAAGVLLSLSGLFFIFYYSQVWLIIALLCLVGIVFLNFHFYRFFVREKYFLFAVIVVPLHIFYYLYSGISFLIGSLLYLWKVKFKPRNFIANPLKKVISK